MKIKITTAHPASSHGIPVCIVGGSVVDDATGLRACMEALGWSRTEMVDATGKSMGAINQYLYGTRPVPAEVWNVLADSLGLRGSAGRRAKPS